MVEEATKKGTFGLSRTAQYSLVAALAAVLAGVLLFQVARGGKTAAEAAVQPGEQASPQGLSLPPTAPPLPDERPPAARRDPPGRDPFEMPRELREMLEARAHGPQPPPAQAEDAEPDKPRGPDPAIIEEARNLQLKGILGSETNRVAYISNKPVRAGSRIEGFTVLEVREKSVLLKKQETEVEIELKTTLLEQEGEDGF